MPGSFGDLASLSASALADRLSSGEVSSRDATRAALERIESLDPSIRAFITVTPELALEQAGAVDEARARGEALVPLAGVPIAVKDNISVAGVRCTCASRILDNYVALYDAHVVEGLRRAGMPIVGKTNLDEFAMGSSTENSAFFVTRNPHDHSRVPGGSSGGSAAAVAARMVPLALGSDTGGSIRQPAALCGITGLKPTYGRISRYGLVAYGSSLDQIGPMARSVRDAALLLGLLAGVDRRDTTSADAPVPDYAAALTGDVRGLRVGVVEELMGEGIAPEVADAVDAAAGTLEGLGATVGRAHIPHVDYSLPAYYLIAPAEASSNLARYDGVRYGRRTRERVADTVEMYSKTRAEGFGAEVQRRIMMGTYALSAGYYDAYYLKAQKVRTLLRREFEEALREFDVLVSPTSPTVAFGIGELADDPIAMYKADICTLTINLAGLPGISIPCGFSDSGLPIGLQLVGRHFDEETILRAGDAFQRETGFHVREPAS
jgi:aspartyl-tRNA(Asn)/glutamyl-tRNA(Gln) amidotransferase subunit A